MRQSSLRWLALAPVSALALGCGGAASEASMASASVEPAQPELDADAWTGQWRRLALPDLHYTSSSIARTPSGWLVASSGPHQSFVYRSTDGVRWQRLTLTDHDADIWPRGVTYGNGRYVIVGHRRATGNLVLTSSDGEHWRESPPDPEGLLLGLGLDGVDFAGTRFFGRENDVWISSDAASWEHTQLTGFFAPEAVAFGAERYMLVGYGAPQLSFDGIHWSAVPIDCALKTACFTDYEEGTPTNQYRAVFFAAGHFYVAGLRSIDGQSWEELEGLPPTGYLSGRFVRLAAGVLTTWSEGGTREPIDVLPAPDVQQPTEDDIPESLDYSWSDGLDCTSARCVLIGSDLYLVP